MVVVGVERAHQPLDDLLHLLRGKRVAVRQGRRAPPRSPLTAHIRVRARSGDDIHARTRRVWRRRRDSTPVTRP